MMFKEQLKEELIEQVDKMNATQRLQVLNFARFLLTTPELRGEPGASIVQDIGYFDAQSLDEMGAAINEGTQNIDPRDWE